MAGWYLCLVEEQASLRMEKMLDLGMLVLGPANNRDPAM